MIQILGFEDGKASMVMSYFIAACYLLPLLGGYVADNFFGKYRTIVYFSIPYILGQALLGVAALHNETCLYLSLGLLAMGSGVIKPNISTLMGMTYDQKCPGKSKLRSDAFAMFYGAINIGAFISGLCVPAIRNYFGGSSQAYAIAFLFPAALMIMAFIVFALGKPFYAAEKIERKTQTPEEKAARWVLLRRLFGLVFRGDDFLEHFRSVGDHMDALCSRLPASETLRPVAFARPASSGQSALDRALAAARDAVLAFSGESEHEFAADE